MAWETYEREGKATGGRDGRMSVPSVNLFKSGMVMRFSKAVADELEEAKAERVRLMFDPDTMRIGVKPDPNGAVKLTRNQNGIFVSIRGFFTKYNLELQDNLSLPVEKSHGIYVIDLPTNSRKAKKNRAGKEHVHA